MGRVLGTCRQHYVTQVSLAVGHVLRSSPGAAGFNSARHPGVRSCGAQYQGLGPPKCEMRFAGPSPMTDWHSPNFHFQIRFPKCQKGFMLGESNKSARRCSSGWRASSVGTGEARTLWEGSLAIHSSWAMLHWRLRRVPVCVVLPGRPSFQIAPAAL